MKILVLDKEAYMTDFAVRCVAAGHEVRWWMDKRKDGKRNLVGDGLGVQKIPDWKSSMRWADLIIVPDNMTMMRELRVWHREGYPIFGPNEAIAEWEMNRDVGMKVLEEVGVDVIPSHTFRRISEAKAFLHSNPRRFVSKLNDDNETKAMSYVSKSARDMLFMLEKWERQGALKGEFIFQEFIPGTEVAIGGWFGRGGFSSWFLENFEHKKLMNGEIGVNTGEMGTALRYTQDSPMAEHFLRPLEGHLYRAGYSGYIDVSLMIGKDGKAWPLEFTTRPGWPLFQIQQALHPDPVEWMGELLEGRDTFKPSREVAVGVCVMLPDFPFCKAPVEASSGFPLYGEEKIPRKNFHPMEVMMGEAPSDNLKTEPCVVTAGVCVATISGTGRTLEDAQVKAYRHVKMLEIPNSPMYRTDIGDRVPEAVKDITRHGWISDWPGDA